MQHSEHIRPLSEQTDRRYVFTTSGVPTVCADLLEFETGDPPRQCQFDVEQRSLHL